MNSYLYLRLDGPLLGYNLIQGCLARSDSFGIEILTPRATRARIWCIPGGTPSAFYGRGRTICFLHHQLHLIRHNTTQPPCGPVSLRLRYQGIQLNRFHVSLPVSGSSQQTAPVLWNCKHQHRDLDAEVANRLPPKFWWKLIIVLTTSNVSRYECGKV